MFFEVKFFLWILTQKIVNIFIVNFKVGSMNQVLHVLARVDGLEDVLEGPRDDAALCRRICDALHRERLATTCLAVGKHGPIVSLQNTLEKITWLVFII